ncbi:three-helix bundle dimerization domain-containing protein [Mycolicibacterium sp. GCM10028919]|uniref:three-helix bundle dimerization domain-containing protein n=1 Tax=Mycolicibacterium sp. GCM10028919 TaxID=3273401 RepID=UPI00360D0FD8
MARDSERHQIQQVITRLTATYPEVPQARIVDVVKTVHARFDGRPLREFVPLFVERAAKAELRDSSLLGV